MACLNESKQALVGQRALVGDLVLGKKAEVVHDLSYVQDKR